MLGFGLSPPSANEYTVVSHCDAISETFKSMEVQSPIKLVGHSMGALIALKYASIYENNVSQLVLLNMPIYTSPEEARRDITRNKKSLNFAFYGRSSQILCTVWCYYMRPVSRRIAPLYLQSKPNKVARDSVMHTWHSYSESMANIIENQSVQTDLDKQSIPMKLIYGNGDSVIIMKNATALRLRSNVELITVPGSHNLPLEKPLEIMCYITNL